MTVPLEVEIPPYTEASALIFEALAGSHASPQVPGVLSPWRWGSLAPFMGAPISEVRLDTQSRGQGSSRIHRQRVSGVFFHVRDPP